MPIAKTALPRRPLSLHTLLPKRGHGGSLPLRNIESQLGFQFGGVKAITERTERITKERFYPLHAF